MKQDNWIIDINYIFYRYFLQKDDKSPSSYALFRARILTIAVLYVLFAPIIFALDGYFNLHIGEFILRQNKWIIGALIIVPAYFILKLSSIKLKDIEDFEESEKEILRRKGKHSLIIVLIVIAIEWTIRIYTYSN